MEFNWTNVDGRVNAYVQSRLFTREAAARWDRSLTSVFGARFALDRHWAVSAQYARNLAAPGGSRGGAFSTQLRHRF